MFRVPLLLATSLAVVHRLSPSSTQQLRPNADLNSGYDPDFRETLTYTRNNATNKIIDSTRVEYPPVRVPCQVETLTAQELQQRSMGDVPLSNIRLVFHKKDLLKLKLLKERTNELLIKKNDRISTIESSKEPGKITYHIDSPGLYIVQVEPGSFGFGTNGFDLFIIYLRERVVETA